MFLSVLNFKCSKIVFKSHVLSIAYANHDKLIFSAQRIVIFIVLNNLLPHLHVLMKNLWTFLVLIIIHKKRNSYVL